MTAVFDEPPQDPDDWTEEQWREWLVNVPADPDTGKAHPLSRVRTTAGGAMLGAAMFGLDQAIYGERAKVEILAEADSDGLDLGDVELDMDDPAASRMTLPHDA